MSLKATYIHGSDVLVSTSDNRSEYREPRDEALAEVERAIAEEASTEARALKPFESDTPSPYTNRVLPSELSFVSNDAWTRFVFVMAVAALDSVSPSNGYGMFEMTPKRLADLGIMKNLRCSRSPQGRLVWVGDFVAPHTQKSFLGSSKDQYKAFCDSMKDYVSCIARGKVPLPKEAPDDMTLSGALAVLHKSGPNGVKNWEDPQKRFSNTASIFERANGIF